MKTETTDKSSMKPEIVKKHDCFSETAEECFINIEMAEDIETETMEKHDIKTETSEEQDVQMEINFIDSVNNKVPQPKNDQVCFL